MSTFKMKTSRQLLGLAMGFAVSASTLAAVTSTPTATVIGRAPSMAAPIVNYTDNDANGLLTVGDSLTVVDGAFDDLDGDAQIASTYRWLVDGVEVANTGTYNIATGDAGKSITLFAVPRTDAAITDPFEGIEVAAAGGTADPDGNGQIPVATDDALVSVAVSGYVNGTTPQVGSPLTATPTCVVTCGTVNYQWQIEDAIGSGNFVDIAGATSNTYIPVRDEQRRMIQVVASN
ncbi:ZirU family protein [Pseudomonas laurylsulfatiphila]|uniref:ZirU family protein n=1 Tax=Pseudomonas laurylsulfatiphila TaxID=2011015 RepID=UPI0021607FD4|nr:ZirU family protein [Pseudomonas laurylsulfatiphila]UVM05735.1 ZirU family protein [Pseudomonas laurylsulfatiphila]